MVQANPGNLLKVDYTFIGWMFNSQLYNIRSDGTINPGSLILQSNIDFFAVWQETETEPPPECPHYGSLEKVRDFCYAWLPKGTAIEDELLDRFRCIAADWIHLMFEPYNVKIPLNPAPAAAHHASDLYAAGRYLQLRTPEAKTHEYIESAEKYLELWLEKAEETGLIEKQTGLPAIAIGFFK